MCAEGSELEGAYCTLNLIHILTSTGSVQGSYPDSLESQPGRCILLPLAQWRNEEEEERGEGGFQAQ